MTNEKLCFLWTFTFEYRTVIEEPQWKNLVEQVLK